MRGSPSFTVPSQENALARAATFCPSPKGIPTFIRQDDVPVLSLAQSNRKCAAIIIVIFISKSRQLCIAAPSI